LLIENIHAAHQTRGIELVAHLVEALQQTCAIMQTILNNPLASSYTLGVSAGAGFGAALVIVLGVAMPVPEAWGIPLMAFLFAGIACAGVYGIGQARESSPEMLVLAGIALLFLFQALLALLQFVARFVECSPYSHPETKCVFPLSSLIFHLSPFKNDHRTSTGSC
jgi:ABC-type cobalamin transport system permease subunit